MDFLELAKVRMSVRKYTDKQVEQKKLDDILEAGRVAPTAANKQPNTFLIIQEEDDISKLNEACNTHGAPLAIIVCADVNQAWVNPFDKENTYKIDATIATDHMMLCAQDLGISTCWMTWFNPSIIKEAFNIPEGVEPVNILVLGYGDDVEKDSNRHNRTRKPISDYIRYSKF